MVRLFKLFITLLIVLSFGSVYAASYTLQLWGEEDCTIGSGTYTTPGGRTKSKMNASTWPYPTSGLTDKSPGDLVDGGYDLTIKPGTIVSGGPEVSVQRYADFETAITAIGATETTLVIDESTVVSVTDTLPKTLSLRFLAPGRLVISTGVTLTINGQISAPLYKIFTESGTGDVDVGDGYTGTFYPQWFGAVGDGVTDDSAAFQSAIDTGIKHISIPQGTYLVVGLTATESTILQGAGENNTILKPTSTGTIITFGGNYFGVRDIQFQHDRSFNATAIKIDSSTGTISRWFEIERVTVISFKGAALKIDNAVWECTLKNFMARMCGDSVQDLAAIDIANPAGDSDFSNNFIMKDCVINLSRYYAIRAVSGKDLASYPGLRRFVFRDLMVHGGTDEGDITPYAGDSVLIDGYSNLIIDRVSFAQIATTYYGIVLQSSLTNKGLTAQIKDCLFTGEAAGNGIKLDNTGDTYIGLNHFQSNFTNDIRLESDVVRTFIDRQQLKLSDATISISDATSAADTVVVGRSNLINAFTDADTTPSVLQRSIFRTANTGATTITTFDDGLIGQEITVLIRDDDTIFDFTGTALKGNNGSDWSALTNDTMRCVYNGTNWFCDVNRASFVGSDTWDPGNILDGDEEAKEITVTGAALGDFVLVAPGIDVADLQAVATVTATNTVTIVLSNSTGAGVNLGSATWTVKVIRP
jgi:hypothetical protein